MKIILISIFFLSAYAQVNLTDYFGSCQKMEETFDDCIKDGINNLRPYYKSGLPDYNVKSLDPFFVKEIRKKGSSHFYNYKLILRNVTEAGWTASHITKLKTDFTKRQIQYRQFFPAKTVSGWYEITGTFLGSKVTSSGKWKLNLFDFIQTTTITRKEARDENGKLKANPPLNLKAYIETCDKLELHIGHLAAGRTIIENVLEWVINNAWQPSFIVLRPVINDLVSTVFTEIFNKSFQNFPFEKKLKQAASTANSILPPKSKTKYEVVYHKLIDWRLDNKYF